MITKPLFVCPPLLLRHSLPPHALTAGPTPYLRLSSPPSLISYSEGCNLVGIICHAFGGVTLGGSPPTLSLVGSCPQDPQPLIPPVSPRTNHYTTNFSYSLSPTTHSAHFYLPSHSQHPLSAPYTPPHHPSTHRNLPIIIPLHTISSPTLPLYTISFPTYSSTHHTLLHITPSTHHILPNVIPLHILYSPTSPSLHTIPSVISTYTSTSSLLSFTSPSIPCSFFFHV